MFGSWYMAALLSPCVARGRGKDTKAPRHLEETNSTGISPRNLGQDRPAAKFNPATICTTSSVGLSETSPLSGEVDPLGHKSGTIRALKDIRHVQSFRVEVPQPSFFTTLLLKTEQPRLQSFSSHSQINLHREIRGETCALIGDMRTQTRTCISMSKLNVQDVCLNLGQPRSKAMKDSSSLCNS